MRVLQRLLRSRSSCSASQQSLPPRSVWQPCNTVLTAVGFPLLGQAGFSEWSLLASFPGSFSILPIFCPFCSPFHCFCHLLRVQHPILHDFRSSVQDELFHNLVAQFVGITIAAPLSLTACSGSGIPEEATLSTRPPGFAKASKPPAMKIPAKSIRLSVLTIVSCNPFQTKLQRMRVR